MEWNEIYEKWLVESDSTNELTNAFIYINSVDPYILLMSQTIMTFDSNV